MNENCIKINLSGLENVTEHYTHTPKFRILFTTFGIYIDKEIFLAAIYDPYCTQSSGFDIDRTFHLHMPATLLHDGS